MRRCGSGLSAPTITPPVGSFRRSDYGMTYASGVIGNVVKLNVTIEAVD